MVRLGGGVLFGNASGSGRWLWLSRQWWWSVLSLGSIGSPEVSLPVLQMKEEMHRLRRAQEDMLVPVLA